MLTLETKTGCRLLLIEVPEGSDLHHVDDTTDPPNLYYMKESERDYDIIELPPGSYEFMTTTDTLTEKQAARLVMWTDKGYPDYNPYNDRIYVDTAIISFRTAMAQAGAALTKTYAILKQL